MESIFNCIHNYIIEDIQHAIYRVRKLSSNTRKKFLKKTASEILVNEPFINTDLIKFQHYSLILDTIDTKLYKSENTKQKKKYLNILAH